MVNRVQNFKGKRMLQKAQELNSLWAYNTEKLPKNGQLLLLDNVQFIEKIDTSKHRNRKNHNQYFTPEFAVEKALSLIPIADVENIIDPAVGNGIFLQVASKKWNKVKMFGVDIDALVIQNLQKSNLPNSLYFVGNSLSKETWKKTKIKKIISDRAFHLVAGNPPFSSWFHRIKIPSILTEYKLAHRNGKLMRSQAIEILFIEIFIKLAREGGYIVIVLPDGILSNPQYRYVREFILSETEVKYIINLPRNVFEDTSAKTSILILEKKRTENLNYMIKFYDLEKTGSVNGMIEVKKKDLFNRMDYWYYHNLRDSCVKQLINDRHSFVPLRDFVVYCKTGKTLYGKERKFSNRGLRFLHTSDIGKICINHEKDKKFIKPNSKMDFKSAHTKIGDILIARVGNGCVGKCGIVATTKDTGIVSDCIFMIRVKEISPYVLTIFLNTKFAKEWFKAIKHGSATTSITKNEVLSVPVPLLHRNTQRAFENQYRKIITQHHNRKAKNSIVYQYFEELVRKLEIRITNGKNL